MTTNWFYDLEGRLTSKKYVDNSTVTYAYESTISRLHTITDALGQVKQYGYALDNQVASITYANAVNPTPNVSFTYDPYFPRLASMTDGNGTTQYSYVPPFSLGALQLLQESSPLANSAIAYSYDELGSVKSRTVAGAGPETAQSLDLRSSYIKHLSPMLQSLEFLTIGVVVRHLSAAFD